MRLIAVVMTALLPAAAMLGYNAFLGRQQRSQEVHDVAAQTARQASSEIERILEGISDMMIAASAIPAVTERGGPGCEQGLRRIVERMESVQTIMVLDETGRLVCDNAGSPVGTSFSERAYFREVIEKNSLVVGGYTVSKLTGANVLPVAMPLNKTGGVKGAIVTAIRLDWLQRRVQNRGLLAGGSITIADRDGVILVRNPNPERFVGKRISEDFPPPLAAVRAGTVDLTGRDGVERIVGYEPSGVGAFPLTVSAGISKSQAFAAIDQAMSAGIAIIAVGALAAVFSALYVGNRFIAGPIQQIVDVLDRWRAGDQTARTRMRGYHGDLGLVGSTIDQMLDELDQRRRMTEAAETERGLLVRELSHRVKNTFAVVQAIARQTFGRRNADDYHSFSQRLGALAGAYDILVSGQWESGDIRDVVLRALRPHHNEEEGRIVFRGGPCRLASQAVLSLSMVVHELATNATKYGALSLEDGCIDIEWRREGERLRFLWRERNARPVVAPERQGFGSRLIRSAFPGEFEPDVVSSFADGALAFSLSFRLTEQQPR